MKLETVFIII